MIYRRNETPYGPYLAPNGKRYQIEEAISIRPLTAEWCWFNTLSDCLSAWEMQYCPIRESESAELHEKEDTP